MTTEALRFGWKGFPEDAPAVWGARWIITQDGNIDQLPDRTDCIGDAAHRSKLLDHLNLEVGGRPQRILGELLAQGMVRTDGEEIVQLYEDGTIVMKGSPQKSHGYFYVTAWLKP